eukprot:15881058-Heterocapsa_arctica.AAC.1
MIASAAVPDMIKCAVVQRWATKEVKELLLVTPIDIGLDYAQLKKLLKSYYDRGTIFDATNILCLLYTSPSPRDA